MTSRPNIPDPVQYYKTVEANQHDSNVVRPADVAVYVPLQGSVKTLYEIVPKVITCKLPQRNDTHIDVNDACLCCADARACDVQVRVGHGPNVDPHPAAASGGPGAGDLARGVCVRASVWTGPGVRRPPVHPVISEGRP